MALLAAGKILAEPSSYLKGVGEAWKLGWRVRARCFLSVENTLSRKKRYTV